MRFSALSSKATGNASKGALALVLTGAFAIAALSSCADSDPTRTVQNSQTYRDPPGDAISPNMRLDRKLKLDILKWVDIQAVKVSSDNDHLITFAIAIPGTHRFGSDIAIPNTNSLLGAVNITVSIRSDVATSEESATVWAISYDIGEGSNKPGHVLLEKPANTGYRISPAPDSLGAGYRNGVATLCIGAADLGIKTGFDFAVMTSVGSGVIRTDRAPGKGWWSYELRN
jgi:hypothetical protein